MERKDSLWRQSIGFTDVDVRKEIKDYSQIFDLRN